MKRRIGALWIATLYAAVSCARGSNLEGVGGSATSAGGATAGPGATAAGSGGSPAGSVSSGVGGSPATTASSTSAVGASSSATTAVSSSSSATTAVSSSSSATTAVSSSSSASSSGGSVDAGLDAADGGTGFGPCVTQQDIDGQSTQPFEIGFCHNPFACFLCSNNAVNPGDIVCSPNCLCAPLPPLCVSDAGADAVADAPVGPTDAAAD